MSKKDAKAVEELAALQVPSHSLPDSTADANAAVKTHHNTASSTKTRRLPHNAPTHSSKPLGTPGYQNVLDDIERRRAREMRRTLRVVDAAHRKRQYRKIALAALLVVALALAAVLFTQLK